MLRATPPTPGSVRSASLAHSWCTRFLLTAATTFPHARYATHTCTLRNARSSSSHHRRTVPRAISFIATAIRVRVRRRSHTKRSSMNQPWSSIRSLADSQRSFSCDRTVCREKSKRLKSSMRWRQNARREDFFRTSETIYIEWWIVQLLGDVTYFC